jgi:hypothetical protein
MGVVHLFTTDMSAGHTIRWEGISNTATSKPGGSRIDDGLPELPISP